MKNYKKNIVDYVKQGYRVECNCGSKYFANEDKANAYYDYVSTCEYGAELWAVGYFFDEDDELVGGEQKLLRVC